MVPVNCSFVNYSPSSDVIKNAFNIRGHIMKMPACSIDPNSLLLSRVVKCNSGSYIQEISATSIHTLMEQKTHGFGSCIVISVYPLDTIY